MTPSIIVSAPVADALADNRPVVALESTIISHGLPRPATTRPRSSSSRSCVDAGVTPATIAVLDGVPQIGLDAEGVRRIAEEELAKASVRDLPILAARGAAAPPRSPRPRTWPRSPACASSRPAASAACTAAQSTTLRRVGRPSTLAVTPITVVSAGVKSVLDIAATLERLETLSVPVIGYGT